MYDSMVLYVSTFGWNTLILCVSFCVSLCLCISGCVSEKQRCNSNFCKKNHKRTLTNTNTQAHTYMFKFRGERGIL